MLSRKHEVKYVKKLEYTWVARRHGNNIIIKRKGNKWEYNHKLNLLMRGKSNLQLNNKIQSHSNSYVNIRYPFQWKCQYKILRINTP